MHDAHETHAHAAQKAPETPCECEQQFGNALPLILVALAVVMAIDRFRYWRKKRTLTKTDESTEPRKPVESPKPE